MSLTSLTILNDDELKLLEHRMSNLLGDDVLMRRAGEAAAAWIRGEINEGERVTVLAGPGNNGGDAVCAALALRREGVAVELVMPGPAKSDLCRRMVEEWRAAGGTISEDPYMTEPAAVVVDGLFGTGQEKPVSGAYLDAVLWFNERRAKKLSLDVPTGLNPATGNWIGTIPGCRADATMAFLAVKAGLYLNEGPDAAGEVILRELDVSVPLSSLSVTGLDEFRYVRQERARFSHKGTFGKLLVTGGDTGRLGAAFLASRAALRLGAGSVTLEAFAENVPAVDPISPELMFATGAHPVDGDVTATVIGPGLGQTERARARVEAALKSEKPLVIDADALNLIAANMPLQDLLLARRAATVITPHEGEAARLLRRPVEGVTVDRVAAARELAVQSGAIVVLKGTGTVTALRSGRAWVNPTGNAMLATAGSGDVLAGIIGAFLAQKFDAVESALAAVWIHGQSVDGCLANVTASDILEMSAETLEVLRARSAAE